ncbi:MobC family plasmid mobilization relaxosome protein [Clostridium botulinum]|uniref:Bacterial mobilization protein MobC n=1 Tax=Clostridium botulinum TaxID=1491 RepID=A0A0A0UZN6_CLOBO|nr:MobC family plasmid mobilization relaxosome protein [Clostridium botulinum]AIW54597.1 bacterial mobilization protein MobC [Clostridium botulinum]AIW54717.1 bacterial mobilization protein MobC [Clostridium botulinum]AIW54779.1 bacterial mobilization protein MobC [Clostridium botulinum]AIW54846.1 bacterial mobilization protein MobC [Clostridium botulinum]MBY7009282.1 plasmid mobilization relaxosome protein MobC [Clostridium botulinum]
MKNNRIRNLPLKFYATEEEKKIIDKKAKELKLDRSKYLRKVALQEPIINVDMSYLNNVIYELNKIGNNINQIAKYTNTNHALYKNDIKEIQEKMDSIWEVISQAF